MKYGILYISIAFLSILQGRLILPDENNQNWKVINTKKAWVGTKGYKGIDWCRAKGILNAPIGEVRKIIEDKKNYPHVFKRIEKAQILTDEIVYIALDMPFPFAGRDYVVQYFEEHTDTSFVYRYYSIDYPNAPSSKRYVRLPRSTGEWRLIPVDSSKTEVIYTWNGELLGNFPGSALPRAWVKQGTEVFGWLRDALKK